MARSRPLRALRRPRLDAALRRASPSRLREDDDRRDQALPPARFAHARAPRIRPHARRRDHDRAARPGPRQCRRHGDRRAPSRRVVRQRHRRSFDLRARLRRRPDGRHQPGGDSACRAPQAAKAHRALRRQWHLDRRSAGARRQRRSGETLRGGGLGGDAHRRPRSRGDRPGDRCGAEIGAAVADRLPHHDRLRRADQGRHGEEPRRPARRRGDRGGARKARLERAGFRDSAGHPRRVARRRRARQAGAARLAEAPGAARSATARRVRAPQPRCASAREARRGGPRGEGKARGDAERDRHPRRLRTRARQSDGGAAGDDRRLGRPHRLQQYARQGHDGDERGRLCRPLHPLRRARARHGGGDERHGAAWRHRPLLRDVPDLLRLLPAGDPACRADGPARHPRDDARLDRARRGRADASAGRASRRLARDPEPESVPAVRCGRDHRVLAARIADDERAEHHRPDAAECAATAPRP